MGVGSAKKVELGSNLLPDLPWDLPCTKVGLNGTRMFSGTTGNVVGQHSGTFIVV